MIAWLASKNADTSGKVPDLRYQIKKLLEMDPHFKMDEILKERNVTVVRLPPYHCEVRRLRKRNILQIQKKLFFSSTPLS